MLSNEKSMLTIKTRNAKWLQRLVLHSASVYFAKRLGITSGQILIECTSGLRRIEKCRGVAHKRSGRNRYHIQLERSLAPLALVNCLAHEMIHVRQWHSGKMEDIDGRQKVRWGKRMYTTWMAYEKHPWEIEAYRYAPALARGFLRDVLR